MKVYHKDGRNLQKEAHNFHHRLYHHLKWKCSRSPEAALLSLLVRIPVTHMFWFPLVPSTLDYFHGHQECKPCLSINGTHASPSGTHDEAEGNSGVPDFSFVPDSHGVELQSYTMEE
ncbi:hypothetical protein AMTR_s00022p00248850 [Amborella trichopoda]|uniref:Uncharacterized protein n=1 Tax=Amborella trichopoda TaxID=13333 RepID=W1PUP4_AMBTC|nr:hypothetical protein AMTR_s00022p00248850 [Amborella trichopoda]